jgi:uncharacterized membrane protein YgcG
LVFTHRHLDFFGDLCFELGRVRFRSLRQTMKRLIVCTALAAALAAGALPAFAAQYVQDNAGLFNTATVDQLNTRITNFHRDTGKEIVVVTASSVPGGDAAAAAENTFAQQSVNGVLIFVDKGDRQSRVLPDRAAVQAGWWSSATSQSIVNAMNAQFHNGDFDGGITTAVNMAFDVYRSHLGSLHGGVPATTRSYAQQTSAGGVHIGVFWWIIIALFVFFIIRSLIRASQGAYYGGGYGGPGYGPGGGPGYGAGYGPGYGGWGWGGGWGGGFWSGLLGGLGGAWLGNELFGRQNYGGIQSGVDPGAVQSAPDAGGWQADPGQADMGGGAGGGWGGDFGGGFGGGGFGGGDGGAGGGW